MDGGGCAAGNFCVRGKRCRREQPAVQTGKQITEETGTREPERQKKEELSLHAQSAVLIDGKTGRVLYGKGEGLQRPMASTTKIMTCILALEKGNLEDPVQVSQRQRPSQKSGWE